VHAPVTAKSGDAELKLAGKADVVEDQSLRTKLDDLFWQMIAWRPAPDSHYFEILAQRAAFVTYDGSGQIAIRWQTGGDEHAHIAPAFDVAHVVPYPAKVCCSES
jgi:hypothetical protein